MEIQKADKSSSAGTKDDSNTTADVTSVSQPIAKPNVSSRSIALEWWNNPSTNRFELLRKYGYQDAKKPWKYRPLTDKGIYLIWCHENGC